ncbi:MAG: cren protein [Thermoprotei archaeon]|nr:MAG: cren protein [Thermoprotei archaeon]
MGLKKGKYVYVRINDKTYVKVRVLKSKSEENPERYIVVGPIVKEPPWTARVIDLETLPDEVASKIREEYYALKP